MTTVVHPGDSLSSRQCLAYVIVVAALTPPDPFTVDLYPRPSRSSRPISARRRRFS
jgi:hypothetical protein